MEIGGAGLRRFFDAAIRGTQDLPLPELLADFGVSLELRAALGPDDKGGTARPANGERLALGIGYRERDPGWSSAPCSRRSRPASGLEPRRRTGPIDRLKVNERNFKRRLTRFEAGERVTASVFRGDELIEVGLVLRAAPLDTCYLAVEAQPAPEAAERRRAWLGE